MYYYVHIKVVILCVAFVFSVWCRMWTVFMFIFLLFQEWTQVWCWWTWRECGRLVGRITLHLFTSSIRRAFHGETKISSISYSAFILVCSAFLSYFSHLTSPDWRALGIGFYPWTVRSTIGSPFTHDLLSCSIFRIYKISISFFELVLKKSFSCHLCFHSYKKRVQKNWFLEDKNHVSR